MKKILHVTPFFSPNIGGVETHLDDLLAQLSQKKYPSLVLTYSPITTPNTPFLSVEKYANLAIRRFHWFGFNLFHRLEKHPILNFLYLTPYLLLRSIIYLTLHPFKADTIHSHGLNAALIGLIIQKIFRIPRHIVSLYSNYDQIPISATVKNLTKQILNSSDMVLTQSQASLQTLKSLGIKKVDRYTHWIDLNQFKPNSKLSKFTILFVGRMVPQKGAYLLAKIAKDFPKINFIFIGHGPDYPQITKISAKNIKLLGNIPYHQLAKYYQKCHLLVVPSQYQEGWGRVAMEAIASGTPVIATNLGGLSELLTAQVSILTSPKSSSIKAAIATLLKNKILYNSLQKNCRPYAIKHFSQKNFSLISRYY